MATEGDNASPDNPTFNLLQGEADSGHVPTQTGKILEDIQTELRNGSIIAFTDDKLCELYRQEEQNNLVTVYDPIREALKNDSGNSAGALERIGKFIDSKISRVGLSLHSSRQNEHTPTAHSLFVFAILFNKKDLAYLALEQSKDQIATALIGSHLSNGLCRLATSENEFRLAKDADSNAGEFEKLAVNLIDKCYEINSCAAVKLIIRQLETWQSGESKTASLLSLAHDMGCEEFLGTTSCQSRLEQVWRGYFIGTPTWMMVVGLIFPFHLCFVKDARKLTIIRRNKEKRKQANQRGETGCCKLLCSESWSKEVDLWHPSAKNCFGRGLGEDRWHFLTPLTFFYTTPMIKFFFYAIASVVFVILFSFFMVTHLGPTSEQDISFVEYVVWVWAGTTLVEEMRQMVQMKTRYFTSGWNILDMIIHILMLLSIILRCVLDSSAFVWARMGYGLTLYLCYIRILNIFYVSESIGPKVIMIKRMMKDILRFMLILLVFLLAYGVTVQALRYPNTPPSPYIFISIIYQPYWNIFGELFENDDQILGVGDTGSCTYNLTLHRSAPLAHPRCAENSWLAVVLLGVYMVLVTVLLLNLLIGMFSSTFANVESNATRIWKFHRYQIIDEYYDKPALAPPLIIFSILWRIIIFIWQKMRRTKSKNRRTPFCTEINDKDNCLPKMEKDALSEVLPRFSVPKKSLDLQEDLRRELEDLKKTTLDNQDLLKKLIEKTK